MAQPEAPQAVKVGVLLARWPDDLGEWLADGSAFEAAGADALWVDPVPDARLDPLVLTAALAAITYRSLLVMTLSGPDQSPRAPGSGLATVERLSHGRLRVFHRIPGDPEAFEHTGSPDTAGRWGSVGCPDGRAAWQATLREATERGLRGLVVPADPRLLDILRNPDDPGYRHDLQLAQG